MELKLMFKLAISWKIWQLKIPCPLPSKSTEMKLYYYLLFCVGLKLGMSPCGKFDEVQQQHTEDKNIKKIPLQDFYASNVVKPTRSKDKW